jgi:hypothetical protein
VSFRARKQKLKEKKIASSLRRWFLEMRLEDRLEREIFRAAFAVTLSAKLVFLLLTVAFLFIIGLKSSAHQR